MPFLNPNFSKLVLPEVPLATVKGLEELRVTLATYPRAAPALLEPSVTPKPPRPTLVAAMAVGAPKEILLPSVAVKVSPEPLSLATTPVLPV